MKYMPLIVLSVLFIFTTPDLNAQNSGYDKHDAKQKKEAILSGLSGNLDQFEYLQKNLEASGKNNKSYDENKNIWISTILAAQAIASICENQQDLLNLFWELRKSRRVKYIDVRIKSLEVAIQQLHIMVEQIRINHGLLPPDLAEIDFFNRLNEKARSTIELMQSSITIIKEEQSY